MTGQELRGLAVERLGLRWRTRLAVLCGVTEGTVVRWEEDRIAITPLREEQIRNRLESHAPDPA